MVRAGDLCGVSNRHVFFFLLSPLRFEGFYMLKLLRLTSALFFYREGKAICAFFCFRHRRFDTYYHHEIKHKGQRFNTRFFFFFCVYMTDSVHKHVKRLGLGLGLGLDPNVCMCVPYVHIYIYVYIFLFLYRVVCVRARARKMGECLRWIFNLLGHTSFYFIISHHTRLHPHHHARLYPPSTGTHPSMRGQRKKQK